MPRSIEDLVVRFLQSGDFTGAASSQSLSKNRAIINRFRSQYGSLPAEKVTFEALDKIINKAKVKKPDGKGGMFAAQKLRKELRRLFRYAVKLGWLSSNPVDDVKPINIQSDGFHAWTEQEIKQFQDYWKLGSRQRMAMELMLWTAKRMGDAIKIGPQHIQRGVLVTTDRKTEKRNWIPVSRQLQKAINANGKDNLLFVLTPHDKPYSDKGFSQRFSKCCTQAGLPHCSAHGLRKAVARRMAESSATNSEMKSITQHSGDVELAIYTKDVNQRKLADLTMNRLSERY